MFNGFEKILLFLLTITFVITFIVIGKSDLSFDELRNIHLEKISIIEVDIDSLTNKKQILSLNYLEERNDDFRQEIKKGIDSIKIQIENRNSEILGLKIEYANEVESLDRNMNLKENKESKIITNNRVKLISLFLFSYVLLLISFSIKKQKDIEYEITGKNGEIIHTIWSPSKNKKNISDSLSRITIVLSLLLILWLGISIKFNELNLPKILIIIVVFYILIEIYFLFQKIKYKKI